MNFMDLFSGIGGFRSGLEKNGHECLAFCEIDKYARQSYKAIYNTENEVEFHDITKISNNDFRSFRGKIDIIAGGFPCQAFSIAGQRRGFADTRGTLFFDIARAIKEIQPSYALLENVKGLFSHDKGRTFGTIIQALDELGYVVEWGLFNSKYWGVPQNRERVFILATRKDIFKQPKLINLLNKQTEVNTRLLDLIENEVDEKYYLSDERVKKLKFNGDRDSDIKQIAQYDTEKRVNANAFRVYDPTGLSPTLNTMQGGNLEPCIRVGGILTYDLVQKVRVRKHEVDVIGLKKILKAHKKLSSLTNKQISEITGKPITHVEHWFRSDNSFSIPGEDVWFQLKDLLGVTITDFDDPITEFIEKNNEFEKSNRAYGSEGIAPTLTRTSPDEKIIHNYKIRKLTPLECWRLQGFTDEQFYKAKNDGVSNSQLYKQAGNSVTVNVIDAIVKEIGG